MSKLSLGSRMKHNYEEPFKVRLPARMPVIIRLDGKCFHTFTKNMEKPFDDELVGRMLTLTQSLCEEIGGAVLGYTQSDEISILLHNYKKFDTQAWFDNEIQKMVSVAGSIASSYMSRLYDREVLFDARTFVLPESEVNNYFVWRQEDCIKNSISMMAQSMFSHKELHKKNGKEKIRMICEKGESWEQLKANYKFGSMAYYTPQVESDGSTGIFGDFKTVLYPGWLMEPSIIFKNRPEFIQSLLVQEEE